MAPPSIVQEGSSGELRVQVENVGSTVLVGPPVVLHGSAAREVGPHAHVARDASGRVVATAECAPRGPSLVIRVAKTGAASEALMDELLATLAAELCECGVEHLAVLVPMERFGILEDFKRAGFLVESLLTEGGVADVSLRVPAQRR